jgi:hypothetical protein
MESYKNVKNVDKYVDNVDYSHGKTAYMLKKTAFEVIGKYF